MNCSRCSFRRILKNEVNRGYSSFQGQNPSRYCLDLVRKNDFESYLCTLLLPYELRAPAFAIRAFNVEIALIQDQTTESAISGMRYKFWNDTLKQIYSGKPPMAPVPLELHRVLQTFKLSKHYFQRLLDARWKKWQSPHFLDLDSLERYSEDTVSPVYYLLLEANRTKDVNVDHIATHLGKAQGITTLIRSVPYHAQKRICVLPQEILMNNDVSSEDVFRGNVDKRLTEAVFQVASRANLHLKKAKKLKKNSKKQLSCIFLPAVNVEKYLEKLQKHNFNVYSPKLQKKEPLLPLHLLSAKLFSHCFKYPASQVHRLAILGWLFEPLPLRSLMEIRPRLQLRQREKNLAAPLN